jgi:hypothetical protein
MQPQSCNSYNELSVRGVAAFLLRKFFVVLTDRLRFVSGVPQQESRREQQHAEVPAVDTLSFLDLLYAVPVGDLAMRVSSAELARVSPADWSALAVILATIVLSWVGLHKDRAAMADENHGRGPIGQMSFLGPQFVQFLVEIIIVGTYFAMGLLLKFPGGNDLAVGPPAEGWLTGLLLLIFALYLVWDLIDIHLARSPAWRETAQHGAFVTAVSSALAGILFIVVLSTRPRTTIWIVSLNAALVIFLYVYRVAQDRWGNCCPLDEAEKVIIIVS